MAMTMMQTTIPKLALFSVSCIQANHRQLPPHVCHQYLLPGNIAPGALSLSQSAKCKQSDDDDDGDDDDDDGDDDDIRQG